MQYVLHVMLKSAQDIESKTRSLYNEDSVSQLVYFNYQVSKQSTYHSTTEEEVVFIHVDFRCGFKDLGAHLEAEQHLVLLK